MKIPVEPACMFPAESEVYGYLDNLRHILFKKKSWWYIETVKFYLVVSQRKSYGTPNPCNV